MPSVEGIDDNVPPRGYGMFGRSPSRMGVVGDSDSGYGVFGRSLSGEGVSGGSFRSIGVIGHSYELEDVHGLSDSGYGLYGNSNLGFGVVGRSPHIGVYGISNEGHGVYGISSISYGVYGHSYRGLAAYLDGNVRITGRLQKAGGSFKIDHPLDPANKYLSHSFVESPDMKNVYDGVVILDDKGEAEIELPDWFGALNKDFRYQLTAIGAPGPNLHISEEISDAVTSYSNSNSSNNNNSRFRVAGGTSGMKVSWQITGIHKDPWANANRIKVEEDKSAEEQGYYLCPDLYGEAAEKGISPLLFPQEEDKRKKQELLINEQNKRPKRKIPF